MLIKFIVEGIGTVIIGAISYWVVIDFPDDSTFLNPLERHVMLSRLRADGQASWRGEEFEWKFVRAAFTDWKTYMSMLITTGIAGPLYALALFFPSVIKELGYSATTAQLLTVAPYAIAALLVSLPCFLKLTFVRCGWLCSRQTRPSWDLQHCFWVDKLYRICNIDRVT